MESGTRPAPRPHWLERERVLVFPAVILLTAITLTVGYLFLSAVGNPAPVRYPPVVSDFIGFWSAGRLAAEGRPEAVYDFDAMRAMHADAVPGAEEFVLPWFYPPTSLFVVLPLGLMPYLPALAAFLAVSAALWAGLIRCFFSDPRAWIVAAVFPPALLNLLNGQNGLITASVAGFALLAIERRPVAAGMLIGALSIKPHLAVLFPIALLAGKRWQSFGAAAATVLGLAALSIAAFGWETVQAFLHGLPTALDHRKPWQVPSLYMAAVSSGLTPRVAMVLQVMLAAAAAIAVWLAWRTEGAPFEAKAATLAAASLLVPPYIYCYDLTWAGLALAFLVRLGMRQGFRRGEREFLAACWIASAAILPVFGKDNPAAYAGWILPAALTLGAALRALQPAPARAAALAP